MDINRFRCFLSSSAGRAEDAQQRQHRPGTSSAKPNRLQHCRVPRQRELKKVGGPFAALRLHSHSRAPRPCKLSTDCTDARAACRFSLPRSPLRSLRFGAGGGVKGIASFVCVLVRISLSRESSLARSKPLSSCSAYVLVSVLRRARARTVM